MNVTIVTSEDRDIDIVEATLLSIDEAEMLPVHLREYREPWWLRTPGYGSDHAAAVSVYGLIYKEGALVSESDYAVRPALRIRDPESSGLKTGDRFTFGYLEFEITSSKLAFCTGMLDICCFRTDDRAPDANEYERSYVRKVIESWFESATHDRRPSYFGHEASGPYEDASLAEPFPGFTFDNFIEGESNRFARSAVLAAAVNFMPENLCNRAILNPLFIWGGSGLGKTHLLYAAANRVKSYGHSIAYTTAEELDNRIIDALVFRNDIRDVTDRFRYYDMLLVDDMDYIERKEYAQAVFLRLFDALCADGKQIIIASSKPVRAYEGLRDELLSRFQSSVSVDIQPPDYELRCAAIKEKARKYDLHIPADVVSCLADSISGSLRQIDGVMKKLAFASQLTGEPVSLDMISKSVTDYITDNPDSEITDARSIISATARVFNVRSSDLTGTGRGTEIVQARHAAMYVISLMTSLSPYDIGSLFHDTDPSLVSCCVTEIGNELKEDTVLGDKIHEVIKNVELYRKH